MNSEVTKCGLFLLGGIVLGAIGATAVSRGKLKSLKPLCSDILSRGYDIREKVLEKVDEAREDISDVLAEAQAKSESRRKAQDPELDAAGPVVPEAPAEAEKAAAA